MTYFLKNGNTFRATPESSLDISKSLPALTYSVKKDMTGQYFLNVIDDFSLPKKFYGNLEVKANKIINTFMDRPAGTGVLLSGEKGSGKTQLARFISVKLREMNIPTLIINEEHCGEEFNNFIQVIDQPVVVIFDEFEKVYSDAAQEALLTLFDGAQITQKLFLVTCNDVYAINNHMTNRPGRFYYHLKYDGVDAQFIREYCDDNLKDDVSNQKEVIVRFSTMFRTFNFDMLKALVEELNRYGGTVKDHIDDLNAKPTNDAGGTVYVFDRITVNGVALTEDRIGEKQKNVNPLVRGFELYLCTSNDEDIPSWEYVEFMPEEIVEYNNDCVKYVTDEGIVLEMSKKKEKTVSYFDYL